MKPNDSIKLFRQMLIGINQLTQKSSTDGRALNQYLQNDDIVKSLILKYDPETITYQFVNSMPQLIDEGLADGNYKQTKMGPLVYFAGLTFKGNEFLIETTKPSTLKKIGSFLKQTGVSLTPSLIMQIIQRL